MSTTPPLALRRSILFWSGILVMGFLAWVWWMSMRGWCFVSWDHRRVSSHASGVIVESRYSSKIGRDWLFGSVSGGYRELKARPFPLKLLPPARWLRGKSGNEADYHAPVVSPGLPLPPGTKWLPGARGDLMPENLDEYLEEQVRMESTGEWLLFVPYWVVLGITALLWMLLLGWRGRRMRRKMLVE